MPSYPLRWSSEKKEESKNISIILEDLSKENIFFRQKITELDKKVKNLEKENKVLKNEFDNLLINYVK